MFAKLIYFALTDVEKPAPTDASVDLTNEACTLAWQSSGEKIVWVTCNGT
jgi:hypothetical protein